MEGKCYVRKLACFTPLALVTMKLFVRKANFYLRIVIDGRKKWSRSKGSGRYADKHVVVRSHLSELWQEDCREQCAFQPECNTAEGCWSLQKDSTTGGVSHIHRQSF